MNLHGAWPGVDRISPWYQARRALPRVWWPSPEWAGAPGWQGHEWWRKGIQSGPKRAGRV